jgi:2-dehydro-3-deoxygalactonokinase
MKDLKHFFSCDWGTTRFRLRLVDVESLSVIAEEKNAHGIFSTNESWKQSKGEDDQRLNFYLRFLQRQVRQLENSLGKDLQNIPIIISGMASSSIGMMELPYKQLPVVTTGTDLELQHVKASNDFPHDLVIISGLRYAADAMRGEETLLIGASEPDSNEELFIFPGTHSKHVLVKNNYVVDLRTYMTGELFELLSTKSLLAASVIAGGKLMDPNNLQSFENGVLLGLSENILHSAFIVRTNEIFSRCTKEENYFFLSGLIIGAELTDLQGGAVGHITLVADAELRPFYLAALQISELLTTVTAKDADKALIKGQHKIFLDKFSGTIL